MPDRHEPTRAEAAALDVVEKATQRLRVLGALTVALVALVRRPGDVATVVHTTTALAVALALLGVGLHARITAGRRSAPAVASHVGADAVLVVAALWCTGTRPGDPATLLLIVPVLVAAVRFRVLGAVACWAWCSTLLATRAVLEWHPGDSLPIADLGEAAVVLLVVTLPAAYLAEHLAGHLAAAVAANEVAARRVELLATLAAAGRDVSVLERDVAEESARAGAERLTGRPARLHRSAADEDVPRGLWLVDADRTGATVRALLTVGDPGGATTIETEVGRADLGLVGEALEVLGAQLQVALDNATLHERLAALTDDLAHRAHHDPLTGLGNRAHLVERAAESMDGEPGASALLFVDLDGFKPVNDRHGHEAGDLVLVEIGRRLTRLADDGAVVARLGGDEFAVLLTGAGADLAATALRRRLEEAFEEPVDVGAATVVVGASIGLAVAGPDGSTVDDLLRAADGRMYETKAARRPVRAGAR